MGEEGDPPPYAFSQECDSEGVVCAIGARMSF
jgi:hypothetical protein